MRVLFLCSPSLRRRTERGSFSLSVSQSVSVPRRLSLRRHLGCDGNSPSPATRVHTETLSSPPPGGILHHSQPHPAGIIAFYLNIIHSFMPNNYKNIYLLVIIIIFFIFLNIGLILIFFKSLYNTVYYFIYIYIRLICLQFLVLCCCPILNQ